MTLYNTIGKGYNTTRCADPYIVERLTELLQPQKNNPYLEIGCGTGNYLAAFAGKGYHMHGVEPSELMLQEAQKKAANAILVQGYAEAIPYEDNHFAGALALFTFHHWKDQLKGLKELQRVLQADTALVMLSFTPAQMRGYWLWHYFPIMMERSAAIVPEQEEMMELLQQAGFSSVTTEKYFVHDELQDHFLYAHKRRPHMYLLPEVRNGASSFTALADEEELTTGLAQLETDINTGAINHIMQEYENELGDYLFIKAVK